MKIIKIDPENPDINIIHQAAEVLKNGGVLMYPTDTCYGLGADITNRSAFDKIYDIKHRDHNKPVSVIVPDINYITNIAIVSKSQQPYIAKYFPGPVTLIFLTLDQNNFPFSSIGIRIPKYHITNLISKSFGGAYVTTSANIASLPPCYEVQDFLNQLSVHDISPDLILDAGRLQNQSVSTVIDLTSKNPRVIRQGAIIV